MRTPTRNVPHTKAARRERVLELVASGAIKSQAELTELLIAEGFLVTQATVSRDLEELGATKVRNAVGLLTYALSQNQGRTEDPLLRVGRMAQDLLVSVEASGNIVVLRTPPGGAQLLASAIDRAVVSKSMPEILGTVAGDDTVLVITREASGGAATASHILRLAEGSVKSQGRNDNENQVEGKRS